MPVFLHGEFHGQRSLAGYSLWDGIELDMTERLTQTYIYIYMYIWYVYIYIIYIYIIIGNGILCSH